MTLLLDANVLIALVNENHVHHERARTWFAGSEKKVFATCPITEGALVRHYFRETSRPQSFDAVEIVRRIHLMPQHEFWSDSLNYGEIDYRGVIGHRQITYAYLIALAKENKGKLATMDKGLSELHRNDAVWVPNLA